MCVLCVYVHMCVCICVCSQCIFALFMLCACTVYICECLYVCMYVRTYAFLFVCMCFVYFRMCFCLCGFCLFRVIHYHYCVRNTVCVYVCVLSHILSCTCCTGCTFHVLGNSLCVCVYCVDGSSEQLSSLH